MAVQSHTSPYWSNTRTAPGGVGPSTPASATNHPLFVPPLNNDYSVMAPGNIDNFNGSYTLIVPVSPQKASSSTATGLGSIGLAVSGGTIYNDEEGPNTSINQLIADIKICKEKNYS